MSALAFEVSRMTDIDLSAIRERYTLALNAKPSKGPYSEKGITALTDSVCDVPELMAEIDRLNATIQRVRELAEKMQDEQGQSWNVISGNRIHRALEGGEQ